MSVLIAYGTIEGQTGKIARFVKRHLELQGESVELWNTSTQNAAVDVESFDKIIVAGSVHERRHPPAFEFFLKAQRQALGRRPTLLLSISLSAAFAEGMEDAQDYVEELKLRTGLAPKAELLVAGAVQESSYDYYESQVLRYVVLRDRNIDPSLKAQEFTDWQSVEKCVSDFVKTPADYTSQPKG